MRIHTACLSKTIYLAVTFATVITYATTLNAETEPVLSSTGEFGLDARRYYDNGYEAAKNDFAGILPFATGVLTGMTLPVATGVAASVGDDTHEVVGVIAGVSTFGLWLWGGGTLAHKMPAPVPDNHLTGYSETERQPFITGYKQGIDGRRRAAYIFGIVAGLGVDLYILYLIFKDFQGFGV